MGLIATSTQSNNANAKKKKVSSKNKSKKKGFWPDRIVVFTFSAEGKERTAKLTAEG